MKKALTVILGAGASYDCADSNVTPVNEDFRPPLTKHLFDNRPPFNKILAQYPNAEAIADDLRTRISRGSNLEGLLRSLAEKADINRKRQYWEVPLYLQSLLWSVSSNYVISGSTKFHTLVNAIVDSSYEKVLFLTLNYDLFLESALEKIVGFRYGSMDSYGRADDRWCVVKLHGSVHWGKHLLNKPEKARRWRHILPRLDESPKLADEIRALDYAQLESRFIDGQFYYPALGIPVDGKKEFHCPQSHVELACRLIGECTDFLIIGFSALDAHVLECLRHAKKVEKMRIVNGSRNSGQEALERLLPFVPTVSARLGNYQNGVYDGGFRNFTYNDQHEVFLAA